MQPSTPQSPTKMFFRIGEVARLVGVEPHVLRYWETEFRAVRPRKSAKGQRVYSRRDVDTLLRVKELLYTHKFTIAGARLKLRERGVEPPEPGDPSIRDAQQLRETLVALRDDIAAAIAELDRL